MGCVAVDIGRSAARMSPGDRQWLRRKSLCGGSGFSRVDKPDMLTRARSRAANGEDGIREHGRCPEAISITGTSRRQMRIHRS